jgi:hypothetical protein
VPLLVQLYSELNIRMDQRTSIIKSTRFPMNMCEDNMLLLLNECMISFYDSINS